MNGTIGHIGILLGLLSSVVGGVLLAFGLLTKRERLLHRAPLYAVLALFGAVIATFAMERALLTHDFSLAFVAGNNARETPVLYDIAGMWAALQGSILLWVLILASYVAVLAVRYRKRLSDPLIAWALLIGLCVSIFFFSLVIGPADPFAPTVGAIPVDGVGPNALLQDNTLIAVHPVFLYLGFVGFTIPFAFAIASLITGRVGEGWLIETRRFTVFAWMFLTVGVVLGAMWSYQTLGWGGFWGWDPVENAALLPWLTATAYLHSVMVQERRGLLRIWNLSLLIATFSLTIFATYLTRSGVVDSVHAFSDGGIGDALIAFFALVVALGVGLIGWRGDRLRSPGTIDSPVSREGAFLINNLLFAAFALVVLLGTVFPLVVSALNGQSISVGRPYFDAFTVPLGLALLFFMAVAPVLPWRKASHGVLGSRLAVPAWLGVLTVVACVAGGVRGLVPLAAFGLGAFAAGSALRQLILAALAARRRGLGIWRGLVGRANGGMIVHIGIVVIAVGLSAASSYGHRELVTLHRGAVVSFDGHTFSLEKIANIEASNRTGLEALVLVDGHGTYAPAIDTFRGDTESVGTPSIDSSLIDDVYLSPVGITPGPSGNGTATLQIIIQPLIIWLWIGAAIAAVGAVLAAVPGRRRRPTDPVSVPLPEMADELGVPVGVGR